MDLPTILKCAGHVTDAVVKLIGSIAWPAVALIVGGLFRHQLRHILTAVGKRIEDKSTNITIGKDGISLQQRMDVQQAAIATLQAEQESVKSVVLKSYEQTSNDKQIVGGGGLRNTVEITKRLQELAESYMNVHVADYATRLRIKSELAQEMGVVVVTGEIDREWLSHQDHEGLILALASATLLAPEKEDAGRLIPAAKKLKRLHVRYWMLLAFSKLIENGYCSPQELVEIRGLLPHFAEDADTPLKKNLQWFRSLLNSKIHETK